MALTCEWFDSTAFRLMKATGMYVPHFILYFLVQPVAEFHGERSKDNLACWVDDNLARVK